jgi:hypothetical protein
VTFFLLEHKLKKQAKEVLNEFRYAFKTGEEFLEKAKQQLAHVTKERDDALALLSASKASEVSK